MAQRNKSGTNAIPRLVVKIIGGKQVRQFIEEPQDATGEDTSKADEDAPLEAADNISKGSPAKQDVMLSKTPGPAEDRVDSVLRAVQDQAPDRLCVTAPSGDRSLSYIHPKSLQRSEPKAARSSEILEQQGLSGEEKDQQGLSLAVSEELCDWQPSSLWSTEEELAALDPTFRGTLNQSDLTHIFLKNDVPLKLPTFSLLLQTFSDKNYPDQIHYRNLLYFIRGAVFLEELQNGSAAAARCRSETSVTPRASVSAGNLTPACAAPVEAETWLQRFQRLEQAMHLCDTQKTGYMDKDKAKRLIQNYNNILNLSLTTLKINEATHTARSQGEIHLATALQHLKEL